MIAEGRIPICPPEITAEQVRHYARRFGVYYPPSSFQIERRTATAPAPDDTPIMFEVYDHTLITIHYDGRQIFSYADDRLYHWEASAGWQAIHALLLVAYFVPEGMISC